MPAAECLRDDLDALVIHLNYLLRHRRRWRSTNLLERSLGEVQRRAKVMGRFPGEATCLSLSWAVLDLFIAAQNRVRLDDIERAHLARLKRRAHDADTLGDQAAAWPPELTFTALLGRDPASSSRGQRTIGGSRLSYLPSRVTERSPTPRAP